MAEQCVHTSDAIIILARTLLTNIALAAEQHANTQLSPWIKSKSPPVLHRLVGIGL